MNSVSSGLKRRGTIWLVISIQKQASVMVRRYISAHGMGNLHSCEINAEHYIQILPVIKLLQKQFWNELYIFLKINKNFNM